MDGGISRFLGLIRDHRGAVEHDWRTRYGVPLSEVGTSMSLDEAARLAVGLALDPSSHICAAASGWKYPMSNEAMVLADLFDAFARANFKNPKPYPRPWVVAGSTTEHRGETELTQDEVIAALRAAGHDMPVPTR